MARPLPGPIPETYARDISRVLIESEAIQQRIREMGAQIAYDYGDLRPLFVGVLKGVLFFMADLLRAVHIPLEVDFMAISSYSPETREHGVVRITKDLETPLQGRHVIFVEDMIDTGLTLNYLLRLLQTRNPASLHVAVLFDKPSRRLVDIKPRYLGFRLPDLFVVGYGLDYREQYRNLPFVGVLKPEAL
ncbi:MAG: hypoxanthine phosphoribosyltransferase [Nitrospira sp.]|nr:hypoxanthine phosphoribosyltransferase [Nitrospira sp.]MCX7853088.1 hypoxanthine phosphoribosyltransferase [Caldilineales bacterium]